MDRPPWAGLINCTAYDDVRIQMREPHRFLRDISQGRHDPTTISGSFPGHDESGIVAQILVLGAIPDDPDGDQRFWILTGRYLGPALYGSDKFFRFRMDVTTGRGQIAIFQTYALAKSTLLPSEIAA